MAESTTAGVFVAQYIYLDNTRLAAIDGAADLYYYINDHLGTPQKMMDNTSAVVWSADYKPFGEADVTVNTVGNNFRFPGQKLDQETGRHYNWNRYYDPKIGRYLRADPIGLEGGVNFYLYAKANPINWFDSDGLVCQVSGKWAVKPHPANIDVTFLGRTWDWGGGGWFPPRIRIGYLNFEASADIKFSVECEKACLCKDEDRKWTLTDEIPIRHIPINIPVKIKASHWVIDVTKMAWAVKEAYKKAKKYFLLEAAAMASDPDKWCQIDDLGMMGFYKKPL